MPIEFPCESCEHLLRVPDGSGGKNCQCPTCGRLLRIPDANAPADEQSKSHRPRAGQLEVACPRCQKTLLCDASLIGTKGQCRQCGTIFVIARDASDQPQGELAEPPELIFSCPSCEQLFEGRPEMQGRRGKCHACGQIFPIELRPSGRASSVQPSPSGQPSETVDPEPLGSSPPEMRPAEAPVETSQRQIDPRREQPAAEKRSAAQRGAAQPRGSSATPIRFRCSQCAELLEVPGTAVGKLAVCPRCETLHDVPASGSSETLPPDRPTTSRGRGHPPRGRNRSLQSGPNSLPFGSFEEAPRSQPNRWADSNAMDGLLDNAYHDSPSSVGSAASESMGWDTTASQPRSGERLTFKRAFGLVFENAFPSCFLVLLPVLAIEAGVALVLWGGLFGLRLILQTLEIRFSPETGPIVGGIVLGLAGIVILAAALWVMTIMFRVALQAIRRKKLQASDYLDGSRILIPLLVYLGVLLLIHLPAMLVGALPAYLAQEPGASGGSLNLLPMLGVVLGLAASVFSLALGFTPFALLDGQSPGAALRTSLRIFSSNPLRIIAIMLSGLLLYTALSLLTFFVGYVLLLATPVYLLAAIYQLSSR